MNKSQRCEPNRQMSRLKATNLVSLGDLGHMSGSLQYGTLDNQSKWREVSAESPTKGLLAVVCLVCL